MCSSRTHTYIIHPADGWFPSQSFVLLQSFKVLRNTGGVVFGQVELVQTGEWEQMALLATFLPEHSDIRGHKKKHFHGCFWKCRNMCECNFRQSTKWWEFLWHHFKLKQWICCHLKKSSPHQILKGIKGRKVCCSAAIIQARCSQEHEIQSGGSNKVINWKWLSFW